MLELLHLENVGPVAELTMELGARLNLITGDNGLGKSFLLDVAWWALTRTWPAEVNPTISSGLKARPAGSGPSAIEFSFQSKVKRERYRSVYERRDEAWKGRPGRPANPGLVLYAQVDGGFSVWDPARNYWCCPPEVWS
jgi:DNA repair exonuclease SbcCD ATPase subunit